MAVCVPAPGTAAAGAEGAVSGLKSWLGTSCVGGWPERGERRSGSGSAVRRDPTASPWEESLGARVRFSSPQAVELTK